MKKSFSSILFFLFLSNFIFSVDFSFKNICEDLSKTKFISGDFSLVQTVTPKNSKVSRTLNSFGNYFLSAENGIVFCTTSPIKAVSAMTSTYLYQETNGRGKKIDGSKNETFLKIANIISSMFLGKYDSIIENFSVDFKIVEDKIFQAEFLPTEKTLSTVIKKIYLSGSFEKNQNGILNSKINNFVIENFNGDKTEYVLENQVVRDFLTKEEMQYFEK